MDHSSKLHGFANPTALLSASVAAVLLAVVGNAIYNIYLHPLSKLPGSKLVAANNFTYWYFSLRGDIVGWSQRQHEKYGEVVRLGSNKVSYIDPQAWKDIFGHRVRGKLENSKDPALYVPWGNGQYNILTTHDTEEHGRFRKIFSNAFSDKSLRLQEPLIRKYVDELIVNLKRAARDSSNVQDLVKWYNCATFDIIADLVFGEPLGLLDNSELSPWVHAIFGNMKTGAILAATVEYPLVAALIRFLTPKSLIEQQALHRKHTSDRVDKKLRSASTRPDIWNLALQNSRGKLTLPEQYANADVLMVGGSETTATLLSGLTYLFLRHPDKMKKAVEEVRALPADQLTFQGVARLPYLQACLDETLRWYPPVPTAMPRAAPRGGNAVLGTWIPEGTTLLIPHYAAYHSPVNFRDPDSFVPERWLPGGGYDSDRKEVLQPFSHGPRNCLGKNLAYHEMRIIMANILWHFDLELCSESKGWSDQKTYILWQKSPLWVKVKPI
ncbi:Cytochrome p450 protein [Neofusicoccum parvum]|nr:Cytochrome p450 protein [Neofusicoccum parvum]